MKEQKNSKVKITVIENEDLKDINVLKRNITHFYDVMNDAIQKLPEEERSKYLLSQEKLEKMKASGKYNFI